MNRIAKCFECGEEMEETGRNTLYCPSCNVCPSCGCPDADNFRHYAGCELAAQEEEEENTMIDAYQQVVVCGSYEGADYILMGMLGEDNVLGGHIVGPSTGQIYGCTAGYGYWRVVLFYRMPVTAEDADCLPADVSLVQIAA